MRKRSDSLGHCLKSAVAPAHIVIHRMCSAAEGFIIATSRSVVADIYWDQSVNVNVWVCVCAFASVCVHKVRPMSNWSSWPQGLVIQTADDTPNHHHNASFFSPPNNIHITPNRLGSLILEKEDVKEREQKPVLFSPKQKCVCDLKTELLKSTPGEFDVLHKFAFQIVCARFVIFKWATYLESIAKQIYFV